MLDGVSKVVGVVKVEWVVRVVGVRWVEGVVGMLGLVRVVCMYYELLNLAVRSTTTDMSLLLTGLLMSVSR